MLLKATIYTAVAIDAVKPENLERVIVDTAVQEKTIAHPVDSRLLEIARHKVASSARRAGIQHKQTFDKEGKELRRKAGGYAHAKQFQRLKRVVKRQPTPGGRAGHRSLEVRSPHGSLLAANRDGRCVACHQLCCRLQPALADASDRPPGHQGAFLRLLQAAVSSHRATGTSYPAQGQALVQRLSDWFARTSRVGEPILARGGGVDS